MIFHQLHAHIKSRSALLESGVSVCHQFSLNSKSSGRKVVLIHPPSPPWLKDATLLAMPFGVSGWQLDPIDKALFCPSVFDRSLSSLKAHLAVMPARYLSLSSFSFLSKNGSFLSNMFYKVITGLHCPLLLPVVYSDKENGG